MSDSAVGGILAGATRAFDALAAALGDAVKLSALLRELDPELTFSPAALTAELADPSSPLHDLGTRIGRALEDAADAVERLDGGGDAAVLDLLEALATLFVLVAELATTMTSLDLAALGVPPHARTAAYWENVIAVPLAHRLLADRLARAAPLVYGLLVALAVIDEADPARRIRLAALGDALADPAGTIRALAGWGAAELDAGWITGTASDLLGGIGLPVRVVRPPAAVGDLDGIDVPDGARAAEVPLLSGMVGGALVEAGVLIAPVATGRRGVLDGLLVTNLTWGAASAAFALAEDWTLTVTGDLDATAAAGVLLTPQGAARVGDPPGAEAAVTVVGESAPPWLLLGGPTSSRVELARVETGVTLGFEPDPDLAWHLTLGGARLVIVAGDPLSRAILGVDQVEADLDLELRWTASAGFSVAGGLGLAFTIPLDRAIGFITLRELAVAFEASTGGGVQLSLAIGFDGELGPFAAAVDGLGIRFAIIEAADGDGAIGPLDVTVALLPPTLLAFALESDAVHGGGFVALDPAAGRYAGGLSLDFASVGIDAIVVVDTQLPGDPDGFALFASLAARFPGLPLGFGFTLLGLGGILAVNRAVDAEALAAGLREGAVDAILFPDDPVRDGPLIIAQLDEFFPLAPDNTVIGPVAQIGWGVPTLITAELGIVLSLPQGVIVLLGSLEALLPTPDAVVLELHMDALGVLDVPGGTTLVTASLYDSRLLGTIELSGDMALYADVLTDPFFLLSIGGFHPAYQPPATVPVVVESLRRLRADIDLGSDVTATLTTYFAVTSNSVQFGGGLELDATVRFILVDYRARGWFDFDVLVEFSPFRIVADIAAGVAVSAGDKELFGVDLSVHVEGPEPWFATCDARFKFFLVKVKFDFTVGGHAAPELPESRDVLALMQAELDRPEAWSARDPWA